MGCKMNSVTLHSFRKSREWFNPFGVGEMIRTEQKRGVVSLLIIRWLEPLGGGGGDGESGCQNSFTVPWWSSEFLPSCSRPSIANPSFLCWHHLSLNPQALLAPLLTIVWRHLLPLCSLYDIPATSDAAVFVYYISSCTSWDIPP